MISAYILSDTQKVKNFYGIHFICYFYQYLKISLMSYKTEAQRSFIERPMGRNHFQFRVLYMALFENSTVIK